MTEPISSQNILIRVQATPNPNALKFITNRSVKNEGKATFSKPSEATGVRLANDLFFIDGVRQLHFFENVITVTHSEDIDQDTLKLEVQSVIQSRLPQHDPDFLMEEERKKKDRSQLPPELQKIEEILDSTVRMYLQGDGGDIEAIKLDGHKLFIRYQGACGTCPSSASATLDAIQSVLREQFDPEIELEII